jgi:hypothetical protein
MGALSINNNPVRKMIVCSPVSWKNEEQVSRRGEGAREVMTLAVLLGEVERERERGRKQRRLVGLDQRPR